MQKSDVHETGAAAGAISRPATGYVPTLDGWRAVAVVAVIAFHDSAHRVGPVSDAWLHAYGSFGVDLFFAISGLLICSRLLEEERGNGRISLRNFYVRRTFRIVPAMMAYLAVIAGLGLTRAVHAGRAAWLASLFFVNNYYSAVRQDWSWSLYTNHLWSLAVEEHFYLLLPALLVLFPRRRKRVMAGLIVAFLLWALVFAAYKHRDPALNFYLNRTDLRIDALLFPALLAVLLQDPARRARCVRWCHPWVVLPGVALMCCVGHRLSVLWMSVLLVPFSFPLLILSTTLHPGTTAGRVLEWGLLRRIGRISYGLYLWQQLFFPGEARHAAGLLGQMQRSPWNMLATLALALLSYQLLEKPLIRLGHRLAPPATPGHANLDTPAAA